MKYVIVKILKSLLYTVNMRSGTIKENHSTETNKQKEINKRLQREKILKI